MKTVRRVNMSAMSAAATFGVASSIAFGLALIVAIALLWGPVPALVVGLALSLAGTVWARSADREQHLQAQPAPPGPGRFRDPEDDPEKPAEGQGPSSWL